MATFPRCVSVERRVVVPRRDRPVPEPVGLCLSEAVERDRVAMQLLGRDGDRCYFCGEPVGAVYQIDHVIPRSRAGTDDLRNLALVHPSCNSRKGARFVAFTVADRIPHLMDA